MPRIRTSSVVPRLTIVLLSSACRASGSPSTSFQECMVGVKSRNGIIAPARNVSAVVLNEFTIAHSAGKITHNAASSNTQ